MTAIDKLIATAEAELGYLEKKSNKDLDDKTTRNVAAVYHAGTNFIKLRDIEKLADVEIGYDAAAGQPTVKVK